MAQATDQASGRARIRGQSLVAGSAMGDTRDAEGEATFRAVDPETGGLLTPTFAAATPEQVDAACWAAWRAFHDIRGREPRQRAAMLDGAAQAILDLDDELIQTAVSETGLSPARLVSERERTVSTLRVFAEVVRRGDWVQACVDQGQPSRRPVPKPDIRRMLRPLGPAAVFGASNFPLAYSTAGGDTASAFAAGCPVVVKGHPAHPGTGELIAQALVRAVDEAGMPSGVFSFLHAGGTRETAVGEELLRHPCIRAVGFTGSFGGGTALARIAADRPDPIPVFAEMGSTNPVFVLSGVLDSQAEAVAERIASSATIANGQMCTCPGLVFAVRGSGTETLMRAMVDLLNQAKPATMLNHRVRANFTRRVTEVASVDGVELRGGSPQAGHRAVQEAEQVELGRPIRASAALFRTNMAVFRQTPTLREEVFGPALILVLCESEEEMAEAAGLIQGSLTGTIWASGTDGAVARRLMGILEHRVGRLIFNGVPTGVEVCASMVHGGPYPATNQPHTTAVGHWAITRWCRPVCFQNCPEVLLPSELKTANPMNIRRVVNGESAEGALPMPRKGGEGE